MVEKYFLQFKYFATLSVTFCVPILCSNISNGNLISHLGCYIIVLKEMMLICQFLL